MNDEIQVNQIIIRYGTPSHVSHNLQQIWKLIHPELQLLEWVMDQQTQWTAFTPGSQPHFECIEIKLPSYHWWGDYINSIIYQIGFLDHIQTKLIVSTFIWSEILTEYRCIHRKYFVKKSFLDNCYYHVIEIWQQNRRKAPNSIFWQVIVGQWNGIWHLKNSNSQQFAANNLLIGMSFPNASCQGAHWVEFVYRSFFMHLR